MASKKIIDAIKAVRGKVPSLKKDETNKYGGYNFVPIDTYYEKISKVATEAGLIWRTRETGFDTLGNQGKDKDRTFVKVRFTYDLFCEEEEMSDYMHVTIIAPLEGAQSTGIVYSYADKVFMRSAFCVVTGEEDADSTKAEPIKVKLISPPKGDDLLDPPHDKETGEITDPPFFSSEHQPFISKTDKEGLPVIDIKRVENKGIKIIEEIFKTFMPTVTSSAKLEDWHTENLAVLEMVKEYDPDARDRIKALFKARNRELKSKT